MAPTFEPAGRGVIDSTAFAHIFATIVGYSDHNALLLFRQTCKDVRALAEMYLGRKRVVLVRLDPDNESVQEDASDEACIESVVVDSLDRKAQPKHGMHAFGVYGWAPMFRLAGPLTRQIGDDESMREEVMTRVVDFITTSTNNGGAIRTLRVDTPTAAEATATVRSVHTLVLQSWPLHDTFKYMSIRTADVGRVALNIASRVDKFSDLASVLLTPPPLQIGIGETYPELVVIFQDESWSSPPPSTSHWPEMQLCSLGHFMRWLFRGFFSPMIIFVDALPAPSAHVDNYRRLVIESTCAALNDESVGATSRTLATTAIRNIKFLSGDEYRQQVGAEQFALDVIGSATVV